MRHLLAAMTVVALLVTGLPGTNADHQANNEFINQAYLTSSGAWSKPNAGLGLPQGNAYVICPDAFAWPLDPDWDPVNDPTGSDTGPRGCNNPDPIIPHIGSAKFFAEHGEFSALQVTPIDDIFGANAAITSCLWNLELSSRSCGNEDHERSEIGCGEKTIPDARDADGTQFTTNRATVFVFTLLIEDDLSVCGGSSGEIQAEFYHAS